MSGTGAATRRSLPAVDRLLKLAAVASLVECYGRPLALEALRVELAALRAQADAKYDEARFVTACTERLSALVAPSLRPVFNLTGTVLHTNLGRAVMAEAAADAVRTAMTRPVNLEFDLGGGARGERDEHVERWITRLTGAEAALVVNNNAAAVYLVLNTFAADRAAIVSRGELVEIGGSFRIPDIMARAGTRLVEIGTTNRTHAKDYRNAIGPDTALLMRVHTSNYAIHGFTKVVPEPELAEIARAAKLPFVVDLGSGTLVDLAQWGLPHEPTPQDSLAAGADLVTFSGDKLLGGPQAGMIVGRRPLIEKLRANPMKRALRVDKMVLAALEATLRLYADPARLAQSVPTLAALTRPLAQIREQAARLLPAVAAAVGMRAQVRIADCKSQIGSGALPVDLLPSAAIGIAVEGRSRKSAAGAIADAFRGLPVPVLGRIEDGEFLLDLRTLLAHEDELTRQLGALDLSALDR